MLDDHSCLHACEAPSVLTLCRNTSCISGRFRTDKARSVRPLVPASLDQQASEVVRHQKYSLVYQAPIR